MYNEILFKLSFMTLSELKARYKAKIIKISHDKHTKIQLNSLGVRIDAEILMVKNDFKGSVILAIGSYRLVLGRDLAEKIEVEIV